MAASYIGMGTATSIATVIAWQRFGGLNFCRARVRSLKGAHCFG